jgi:C1A family cysteine protease
MMLKKILFLLPSFFATSTFSQNDFTSGVKRNDANYKKIPLRVAQAIAPLSERASLKKYAPKAGNQAQFGTCLAWAMASSLTIQEARLRNLTNQDSIQSLFYSPAHLYYIAKDSADSNCRKGTDVLKMLNAIQQNGLLRDHPSLMDCMKSIPNHLKINILKKIAPICYRLTEPNAPSKLVIKAALSGGNPVIVVFRSLDTASHAGHAVCVVGYDDKKDGGAFELLNSIGTHFGTDGYGWITYKAFEKRVCYAIEVPPFLSLPR